MKRGGGPGFIYLIFVSNYLLFIFFCHIFHLLKGEGGMGFVFFSFLYCVLSFCYPFLFLPGEGGVGFFFIFKLLISIYLINFLVLFLLFEGRMGGMSFSTTC